ncbi:hypothetical protein PAEPH01_2538 [Pancytospora epiphaga]|nr:hypothetical protein PAEPH01_2538 [Pancytospora epiphaga]
MLLPPQLDTESRKEYDLNDLRIYYMICEDLGIADDDNIQKSFQCLMGWAGKHKFMEEFSILKAHIDKKKQENGK